MQRDATDQTPTPTVHELVRAMDALQAQAAALRDRIARAKTDDRAAAIDKIRTLMAAHGITPQDLRDPQPSMAMTPAITPAIEPAPAPAPTPAPAPPAPPKLLFTAKYRDKETGNAWSGNGETPSWLKRALADGRRLDEFLV